MKERNYCPCCGQVVEASYAHTLSIDDVAKILKVHRRTVWRRVDAGKLPALNIHPQGERRILRFRPEDIQDYLTQCKI